MASHITDKWNVIQPFFYANIKQNIKAHVTGSLWGESTEDSPHRGPVMRKPILFHDGVMLCLTAVCYRIISPKQEQRRHCTHDDVIKWRHLSALLSLCAGIHRSPVNSPHKGQWRGTLMFSLICAWVNGWVNNSEAGDLRRSSWRHCNAHCQWTNH